MSRLVTVRFNLPEFTATLKAYQQLSKRDPKVICDTKSFFIARRAVIETPKADKTKIQSDMGKVIFRNKKAVATKLRMVTRYSRFGLEVPAPLAALIINKRRGKGRGLYGAEMEEAVRSMLSARMRSIAFIKSGWLPAIKTLMPYAEQRGAPRQEGGLAQVGQAKGFALPAQDNTFKTRTVIANTASAKRDTKAALELFGQPALERAFAAETRSMLEYMERKYTETARRAGIKTH